MLVLCRLAGLSALEAHYVGVGIATQSGAWGGIQTALDHVARGWRGKAAYWPLRAGRSRTVGLDGPTFRLWPLGTQAVPRRRAESKRRLASLSPRRFGGASHSQSRGTDFASPSSSGGASRGSPGVG
jgi:hypothetical protein